jgi:hypothetical protein
MSDVQDLIEEQLQVYAKADDEVLEMYVEKYRERIAELITERSWFELCLEMVESEQQSRR